MNLAGWRFLLFAVVGAAAIILLAGIAVPTGRDQFVDKHTGESRRLVHNVAEAYHEARDAGDAQIALERLAERLSQFPDSETLLRLRAVLQAEFSAPDAPVPEHHPHAAAIHAEQAHADEARAEVGRRITEHLNKESLLALLEALEADTAQAEAVESYFAALLKLHKLHNRRSLEHAGVDERAARATSPEEYPELAESFRRRARPRARLRWLLRAYATGQDVRGALYTAYLEQGRVPEAFLLLALALDSTPDDIELWRERAKLAGWLALPRAEAEAQQILLEHKDSPETRRRLITLYTYTGQTIKAVPHARHLVRDSKDREQQEWPVRLALQAGEPEIAIALLEELAESSEDPAYWREQIIRLALQDLQTERAAAQYLLLIERYPDEPEYPRKLESLYRRRAMNKPLADLLSAKLERNPDDLELEREVMGLYHSLKDVENLRRLVVRRLGRKISPRQFFLDLKIYRDLEIPDLVERACEMASSPELLERDLALVLDAVQELPDPKWQAVGTIAARRFLNQPIARAYLIESLDKLSSDSERAAHAEELAVAHPEEPELLKAWIERASWAGNVESEIRARTRWVKHKPEDLENRRGLADLLAAVDRVKDAVEHWRYLVQAAGLGSDEAGLLIDALFTAGETEEAMLWLERRAALPGTTNEDRLKVAEQLFGGENLDRSLRFYMAVLDTEPDHALALLRAGQIRSWTNDPRGSIPFYERRLEVSDENAGEVRFFLGEAYWAIQDNERARALHQQALAEIPEDTDARIVLRARILARLDRVEEATPLFESVLARQPDNVELLLDYADTMVGIGDAPKARKLTDRAKVLAPRRVRTMRTDGKVALIEKRYEHAAAIFEKALKAHGPDAGTESELGRSRELAGDDKGAHEAYERSLHLQPDNRDIEESELRMWDKIARIVHANFEYRSSGNDSVFRAAAAASILLGNDTTRVGTALGFATYDADGQETQTLGHVRISALQKLKRQDTLGAGIEIYPGAPGDTPVGGWIDLRLQASEPARVFGAHIHLHTLFDDPAAAVALGGRSTGLTLYAQGDLTRRLFGVVETDYSLISLDQPGMENGRLQAAATIGYRLIEGNTRTGTPLDIGRSAFPGLIGPDLNGSPERTRGPLVSVWFTYHLIRLLDDKALATAIPIGEAFDYLTLGARADFHLAHALGLTLEGHAGTNLDESDFFFGLDAAVSWRPSPDAQLTCAASYGTATGRADSADTFVFRFHFSYRW